MQISHILVSMEEQMSNVKDATPKGWLSRNYLNILLILAIVGIVRHDASGWTAVIYLWKTGPLKGEAEILRLPRANRDTVFASLDSFRESWQVQKPGTGLVSRSRPRWANMRINMAKKFINEQNNSRGSPGEISFIDNSEIKL